MPQKPPGAFIDFATLGPDVDTSPLDRLAALTYFDFSAGDEVPRRIDGCEIVIVNKAPIPASTLAAADRLRLIVVSATGTDNVDTAAAREQGIAVANVRDYCSTSVVQHVYALVLSMTQRLGEYDSLVRAGAWSRSRSFTLLDYPIRELCGRNLGIIGYGALGRSVAALGSCLGMQVLVAARRGTPPGEEPEGRTAFETVLAEADVLSLHCPLNEATRHLIGAPELELMKDDALLINTARGGLIDGGALAEALRAGRIGGAGIDVLPSEPPEPDQPLLAPDIPNLIVTPHVAWAALEARQRALNQVAENIEYFLAGRDLRRVV